MTSSIKTRNILIAGAGIGGLVTALALIQRGFTVTVLEQAPELGEVGAGLQISSNGTRVLFELGLEDALHAVAWKPEGKVVRLWNTGKSWELFDLNTDAIKRFGFPYLMFHRADFHRVLADAVMTQQPGALRLNAKVRDFVEHDDRVVVRLEGGEEIVTDALIGADGVHSAVRETLVGADRPSFTGLIAWRGVIPRDRLPASLLDPVGTNWVGPGRHVIHYFLRRGELLNFVGIVERKGWEVESWTTVGSREECARDFCDWHEDIHALIENLETPYKWALMVREPLSKWSSRRVTLLGDAAHPTLPFLAQGAVMAIEDGYILARAMHEHERDVRTALNRYEKARVERTSAIVRGSAANTKVFHNPSLADPELADDYVTQQWSRKRIEDRYTWLFEYDATMVPL